MVYSLSFQAPCAGDVPALTEEKQTTKSSRRLYTNYFCFAFGFCKFLQQAQVGKKISGFRKQKKQLFNRKTPTGWPEYQKEAVLSGSVGGGCVM